MLSKTNLASTQRREKFYMVFVRLRDYTALHTEDHSVIEPPYVVNESIEEARARDKEGKKYKR